METQRQPRYFFLRDYKSQRVGVLAFAVVGDGKFLRLGVSLLSTSDVWCTRTGVDKAVGRFLRADPLVVRIPHPPINSLDLLLMLEDALQPAHRQHLPWGLWTAQGRVDWDRAAGVLQAQIDRVTRDVPSPRKGVVSAGR